MPEFWENATISSSPSPLISPTEIEDALSQVWTGLEVVIPLDAVQSAHTIEVEKFDWMFERKTGSGFPSLSWSDSITC